MLSKFTIRLKALPFVFSAAMLIFGTAAYANPILIFNTGVNSSGVVLPNGTLGGSTLLAH